MKYDYILNHKGFFLIFKEGTISRNGIRIFLRTANNLKNINPVDHSNDVVFCYKYKYYCLDEYKKSFVVSVGGISENMSCRIVFKL